MSPHLTVPLTGMVTGLGLIIAIAVVMFTLAVVLLRS